jgi:hypothetical protein
MNIITSRRKFLTTTGGIIAASAFARAGLFAAEAEKEKEGEEEVSPAQGSCAAHCWPYHG